MSDLDPPMTDLDPPMTDLDLPMTDLDLPKTDLGPTMTDLDPAMTDLGLDFGGERVDARAFRLEHEAAADLELLGLGRGPGPFLGRFCPKKQ